MFNTSVNLNISLLIQDGSTNSSPIFSSAENSFDKSKLVVRERFSIKQICRMHWLKCYILKGQHKSDGVPCSLISAELQPVESGRQLRPIRWFWVSIFTGADSAQTTQRWVFYPSLTSTLVNWTTLTSHHGKYNIWLTYFFSLPSSEAVPNGHVPPFRSLHMQQSDSSSSEELSVSGNTLRRLSFTPQPSPEKQVSLPNLLVEVFYGPIEKAAWGSIPYIQTTNIHLESY